MNAAVRALAGLIAGGLVTAIACAATATTRQPAPCVVTVESRVNRDLSFMKIITRTCEQADRREMDIRFSPRVGRPARTVAHRMHALSDTSGGGASLFDWDKDGQYEVLIVGKSLITNVDLQLLRLNRTSRRLDTLFRGESLDLFERSGYLVSTVNLSYRGDTQAAYKVLQPHVRVAAEPSFSIFTDPSGRFTCLFEPPSGYPAVIEHELPRRTRNGLAACEAYGQKRNLLKQQN